MDRKLADALEKNADLTKTPFIQNEITERILEKTGGEGLYAKFTIDLSVAHTDEKYNFSGDRITVENVDDAVTIKLNSRKNDSIDLQKIPEIHAPITKFYITNASGSGELKLLCGSKGMFEAKKKLEIIDQADYIIYKDGSHTVAVSGETGEIFSKNIDASTVINLALAKTGCIFIKTGTYPIKSQLDIPSNTSLHGCGKTTILQRHADLGAVALIENADTGAGNDNIEICNLTIDGNDAGHAVSSFGIRLVIVTRALVKDLYIYDTGLDGIHLRTCSHCEIRGINLNNTGNHAIFVGYTSSYCLVSDIISVDPKTEHVCIEWQAVADDNIYITVSDVTGSGAENQGIYIQHAQHILISNCSVYDTFNSGFTLRDCDDVLVNNCISDTTTTNDKACFETAITATNVIFNCCAAYNAESGEASGFVLYGTRITLANSIASGCKRGVETHVTSSDYIDVHNCIFEDYSWGILVTGDFIKYHDNIFSNPDGAVSYCFYVEPSTNIEIYNNDVRAACTGAEIRNYDAADRVEDNAGWVTENGGVSGVIADGATIAHGLAVTPRYVIITGSVAGEIVNVTAIGAANFTVAIKSNAGAAGTNQAIYWRAWE